MDAGLRRPHGSTGVALATVDREPELVTLERAFHSFLLRHPFLSPKRRPEGHPTSRRKAIVIRLVALAFLVGIFVFEVSTGESVGAVISGLCVAALFPLGGWIGRKIDLEL